MFFKCKTFHAETSTYNNKKQKRKSTVSHMVIIGLLRVNTQKQMISKYELTMIFNNLQMRFDVNELKAGIIKCRICFV